MIVAHKINTQKCMVMACMMSLSEVARFARIVPVIQEAAQIPKIKLVAELDLLCRDYGLGFCANSLALGCDCLVSSFSSYPCLSYPAIVSSEVTL